MFVKLVPKGAGIDTAINGCYNLICSGCQKPCTLALEISEIFVGTSESKFCVTPHAIAIEVGRVVGPKGPPLRWYHTQL